MEDNGRYHDFYPRLLYYDEPTPKHIDFDKGSTTLTSWILWNLVVFYYHDGKEHIELWKKLAEENPTIMSSFTVAAVNFILNDAASFCNKYTVPNPRKSGKMMPLPIDEYPVMFDNLENYLAEIAWGNKNNSIMNSEVLPMLINSFEVYEDIVARVDFSAPEISDIDSAISNVIASLPEEVEKYKSGKTALINRFTGEVLKLVGKKADVKIVRERLEIALS